MKRLLPAVIGAGAAVVGAAIIINTNPSTLEEKPKPPPETVDQMIARLLPWVAKTTKLSMENVAVKFVLESQKKLNERYYGDTETRKSKAVESVVYENRIYLPDWITPGRDDTIVIVALTHVLQWANRNKIIFISDKARKKHALLTGARYYAQSR
ncbi:MAG TPA: hypothetical protein VD928_02485 [Candidatus Paceibacterota bacterium]|nr:hypothetical protein [Candidatus Paceibacterota bacterium]